MNTQPEPTRPVHDICPTASGAKDWNPSAFSPRTGFLYIPHNNLCMDHRASQVSYIAGTPYVGAEVKMKAGPGGNRGEFDAWDVAAAKKSLVDQGELSGVEWCARDRGRRGVLRHHGGLVQSSSMLMMASCFGSSRPAQASLVSPRLIKARTAINTLPFCPASAVGPARSFPAISIRAIAPLRSASSTP